MILEDCANTGVSPVNIITLSSHGDSNGELIALENFSSLVPFEIKRIYYIFNVCDNIRRGFHAHKELKQLLVCVNGACDVELDDGIHRETVRLDSPKKAILIESPIWREMSNFSNDCVLLVLASELYNEDDYIWDYKNFCNYVKEDNSVI